MIAYHFNINARLAAQGQQQVLAAIRGMQTSIPASCVSFENTKEGRQKVLQSGQAHANPDCKDHTDLATADGPENSKRQMAFMEIKIQSL